MVPLLPIWEVIKGFLGKDVLELLVKFVLCLQNSLSSSNFFQFMAYEAYKELVTSAHLIQGWVCEAGGLSGFSSF